MSAGSEVRCGPARRGRVGARVRRWSVCAVELFIPSGEDVHLRVVQSRPLGLQTMYVPISTAQPLEQVRPALLAELAVEHDACALTDLHGRWRRTEEVLVHLRLLEEIDRTLDVPAGILVREARIHHQHLVVQVCVRREGVGADGRTAPK
jgi:hypothetical protein